MIKRQFDKNIIILSKYIAFQNLLKQPALMIGFNTNFHFSYISMEKIYQKKYLFN